MRILFAGTPEVAVPSLRSLADSGHELIGVITREDAPLGRKRILTPSPVAQAAEDLGLSLLKANRLDDGAAAWAQERAPELGVVVAYGGLIREPLLSAPDHGWVNLHFSDLPRWRGAAPVQRALIAGEHTLHVSVFRLVPELDAGDILSRDSRDFPARTPAGRALAELGEFGTGALLRAIERLEEDPGAGEPQTGASSYAHKLSREDGRLDLTRSRDEVLARWAGVTPEPGAFAQFDGQPVKILDVSSDQVAEGERTNVEPGEVRLEDGRAILHLSGGTLELLRVQPAGKPAMAGADWLRGRGGRTVLE